MPPPEEPPKKPQSASGAIAVSDMGPNLDRLWAYQCPMTKGRNVSCIAWNRVNPDLLAIGYGQFEYSKQKGGLVCCWSLKNPEVSCCNWKKHLQLLSIHGLYNMLSLIHAKLFTNYPFSIQREFIQQKQVSQLWTSVWPMQTS